MRMLRFRMDAQISLLKGRHAELSTGRHCSCLIGLEPRSRHCACLIGLAAVLGWEAPSASASAIRSLHAILLSSALSVPDEPMMDLSLRPSPTPAHWYVVRELLVWDGLPATINS